jgi:hypothetical protein
MTETQVRPKALRNIETGTVSWGTTRYSDLIPKFMLVLETHAPERETAVREEYSDVFQKLGSSDPDSINYTEEGGYCCEALFNALDDIAPEGYSFHALDGDGTDYGFWKVG